jgi:hypothetical protein
MIVFNWFAIRVGVDGGLQTGSLSLYVVQFFMFVGCHGELNKTLCCLFMARVHTQIGDGAVEFL